LAQEPCRGEKAGTEGQACIYAWNAYRDGKTIQAIKYDVKKGMYTPSE
jgi:hypothetical protein